MRDSVLSHDTVPFTLIHDLWPCDLTSRTRISLERSVWLFFSVSISLSRCLRRLVKRSLSSWALSRSSPHNSSSFFRRETCNTRWRRAKEIYETEQRSSCFQSSAPLFDPNHLQWKWVSSFSAIQKVMGLILPRMFPGPWLNQNVQFN